MTIKKGSLCEVKHSNPPSGDPANCNSTNIELGNFIHSVKLNKTYFVQEVTTDGFYVLKRHDDDTWLVSKKYLLSELKLRNFIKLED